MANPVIVQRPQDFFHEAPALNFLQEAEQSVWKSLFTNLRETIFPEKLPPLELTSKPVAVKEIWSRKQPGRAAAGSLTAHGLVVLAVVGVTFLAGHSATTLIATQHSQIVTPLLSDYVPSMSKTSAVAGGGDHDRLTESKGRLPKIAKQQFVQPTVVIRNLQPKLAMEASIVAPDLNMPNVNLPNIGNPVASRVTGPPSNGGGSGGGIGSGSGGSVGNGAFRMGQAGVTAPVPIFAPDPPWSAEARRNQHEGTVTLQLVVDASGHPKNIRVVHNLGMGLDEKALESVKTWQFEPGKKDGQPVAVLINIDVEFRLH
ncbi:MAG TPA: energy transducer TonB [Candidatus Saccharimonadales bacterium]|jgi:protein TonB|nr:energy transducer TonB [Candidatus Saccharimonadales bacterium]